MSGPAAGGAPDPAPADLVQAYLDSDYFDVGGDGRVRLRLYRPQWRDRWHRHSELLWL